MIQVQIKVGRDFIWIDDHDVIMDNGAILQIPTKQKRDGWYSYPIRMSRKLFNDLKKKNLIYTNETIQANYRSKELHECPLSFYKFHIEKMAAVGYEMREK